ncbi:MAG: SprB repeat-containing protein, partial [Saprospiraceae bacterium]
MKNMIRCLFILFGLAILANARAHNGELTVACDFVVVPTRTVPTCFGSSDGGIQVAVLGNNGPFSYVWSTGLADQPLTNIPAGDYTLTVTDALGCTQVDTVVLGG